MDKGGGESERARAGREGSCCPSSAVPGLLEQGWGLEALQAALAGPSLPEDWLAQRQQEADSGLCCQPRTCLSGDAFFSLFLPDV